MTTWAYKTLTVEAGIYWKDGDRIQVTLDELGKDGWDVFSCIIPDSRNHSTYRLTAKRPIRHAGQADGRKFR